MNGQYLSSTGGHGSSSGIHGSGSGEGRASSVTSSTIQHGNNNRMMASSVNLKSTARVTPTNSFPVIIDALFMFNS